MYTHTQNRGQNMNRRVTLLTAFAMLLASVSCASGGETNDTTTVADTTTTEAVTTDIYTDLGEHDFEEREFTIVYSEDQLGKMWLYDTEEQNGDLVNDAVYKRNHDVGEKYNAKIIYYSTGGMWNEVGTAFLKSIMSDDGAYDLALCHMFGGINSLVSQNALYNFNDLPIVDYDKPWWAANLRDTLEVDGVCLLQVSDLVYKFNDCIYFNKDIMADYKLDENLYDTVRAGKWTWDKLISMAKSVSGDLNGDGEYDESDMYGLALVPNTAEDSNWVYANGMTVATIKNGEISVDTVNSEKMKNVVDKMSDFVNVGNHVYISEDTNLTDNKIFVDGHSLFMENLTLVLPEMRDVEIDFGIIPLPKYDEEQDDYYSMATPQMMAIPANLDDPTFTGVMLEALAMESYRTVNPAVYNVSFSGKYLRDDDSYEMYQIIQGSGVYDFNWNFGNGNKFALFMGNDIVRKNAADTLASYYQANYSKILENLEEVYEIIKNYNS